MSMYSSADSVIGKTANNSWYWLLSNYWCIPCSSRSSSSRSI